MFIECMSKDSIFIVNVETNIAFQTKNTPEYMFILFRCKFWRKRKKKNMLLIPLKNTNII